MAADKDLPPAPTWEEMHLQALLTSALGNLDRFEEVFPDSELKDYIRNRAHEYIRKHNATRTNRLA